MHQKMQHSALLLGAVALSLSGVDAQGDQVCTIQGWVGQSDCEGEPDGEFGCVESVQAATVGVSEDTIREECVKQCGKAGCNGFNFAGICDTSAAPLVTAQIECTRKLGVPHTHTLGAVEL